MVAVARGDEEGGDDVVAKHLPVVLATVLDVDDNNLLQPESPLRQNVALHKAVHLSVGPVGPKRTEVEPVGGLVVDVLDGAG